MKIAVTGSTGLIGRAVCEYFGDRGHTVTRVCREQGNVPDDGDTVIWNIAKGIINAPRLAGHDVIIHLAGANIAGQPWTDSYKKEIRDSRVDGTTLLSETLANFKFRPKLLICASAVGYYGNCDPARTIDEKDPKGLDFLADVCEGWENAARAAERAGIRVVHLRLGVVLSKTGGALEKMIKPFRMGFGGKIGSGEQVMSWIALEEIPFIMDYLMDNPDISGPVNAVSPNPVTNKEFTKTLGEVLYRPTLLPVPATVVRMMFGEMGEILLLGGQRVKPAKLMVNGYTFHYPKLRNVLSGYLT